MTTNDLASIQELLETGTLVQFDVVHTSVMEGPDPAIFTVEIELSFPPDQDTDETDLEWGAFGFLFLIAALAFADARPRATSAIEYDPSDAFGIGDFVRCLQWQSGDLRLSADYLKGCCMKTDVVLRQNGSGKLTTTGRGKSAVLWLDRLKGKKRLQLVDP
jgi:hypothetical protein